MKSAYDLQLNRRNQASRHGERWQPPAFIRVRRPTDRLIAWLRRLLDLQAASIYNDLARLLPNTSGQVLDVGCGAQPYRHLLPADVLYQAIDHTCAKADFQYQTDDTIYYDGTAWPVHDESRNYVLSTETLEHVLQPTIFLSEASRCLKPGGQLILTVPFSARWHYIPHDYWRFTPSALSFMLSEAGLEDIRIYGRGNHVTVAAYKVLALFLKMVFPHDPTQVQRAASLVALVLFSPVMILLALIGHLSMNAKNGDDTLGYTVLASKPIDTSATR